MRIVLDTNVALSALLWRGKPHLMLKAIRERSDTRLVSSPALLAELAEVLSRPSPAKQLAAIGLLKLETHLGIEPAGTR